MFSEEKQRIGNLLNDENFATVTEYSCKNNVTPDIGLNQIVSEWAEKDRVERHRANEEPPSLSNIERLILDVKSTVDEIAFEQGIYDPTLM